MFTDRFIKVPIAVYDKQLKELTGNEKTEDSYIKFLPFELAAYRPTYTTDEPDKEVVNITLKCGDNTLVLMNVKEFEHLLNSTDATDIRLK